MGKKFLSSVLERDDHVRGHMDTYQFKASIGCLVLPCVASQEVRGGRRGFEVRLGLGIIIYGNGCALRNFTEPLPITNLLTFVNWYDLNFFITLPPEVGDWLHLTFVFDTSNFERVLVVMLL